MDALPNEVNAMTIHAQTGISIKCFSDNDSENLKLILLMICVNFQ